MNRSPEQWAALKPDAFLSGSIAQARNVIEMMQADIAEQAAKVERLQRELRDERDEAKEQRRTGGRYWGGMMGEDVT